MGLAILIIVVLQVLAEYNRPQLPLLPDPKHKYENMEGGTANEEPVLLIGKYKICIAWKILHRSFGAAHMTCYLWKIDTGIILYGMQYPESDAL